VAKAPEWFTKAPNRAPHTPTRRATDHNALKGGKIMPWILAGLAFLIVTLYT
jgi:hypothetical protein